MGTVEDQVMRRIISQRMPCANGTNNQSQRITENTCKARTMTWTYEDGLKVQDRKDGIKRTPIPDV